MAMPSAGTHLWTAYTRIRRRKGGTGMGPSPIEWPDILAFITAAQYPLAPWEIEVIEDIDDAYLSELVQASKAGPKPPPKK